MKMKGRPKKNFTDNSKALLEWIESLKTQRTRRDYRLRWELWLEYCRLKGIPDNANTQLEDMKKRRSSEDNTIKYFYDNEVPKFFQWAKTEYKGREGKPLTENSALAMCNTVRSFFAYHRYALQIKKEALPSSEKVALKYEDHAFDIYQLRAMFQQGDLKERTILACGKDLWLRAGDFLSLKREFIELLIKRELELANNENREPDIIEFELSTEKEKEPCSCHLSKETVELLSEYLRTYPKTNDQLFPITEDALNDLLRRLAEKAKITVSGRIRWHCLRKFGITLMHGKVTEPVMKYMTGKHISKDLRTYIQANKETYKAFKTLEPLLSLTKTNANGGKLAKQLEELKTATMKQLVLMKLIEKLTPKEELAKALNELAEELGVKFPQYVLTEGEPTPSDLNTMITVLAKAYEKKDLERILKENGNNT